MRYLSVGMFRETFARFGADNASLLAAALAYSTIFAIAPLIIVAIAIAGTAIGVTNGGHGHHIVEQQMLSTIGAAAGPQTAQAIGGMVDRMFASHQGSVLAQVIGWIMFIVAGSGLFMTLQTSLNMIWHAQPEQQGIWLTVRNRVVSALMVFAIGALMLATIAMNFVVSYLWTHLAALLAIPGASVGITIVNYAIDVAVITGLLMLVYRYLPDTTIGWGDVKVGAIATAVLLVVGEALLSLYIARAGIANGYGAAGSLVVLLVWVYYSAMLFFFGAEFTRVYAEKRGSRTSPEAAEDADPRARGATKHSPQSASAASTRSAGAP